MPSRKLNAKDKIIISVVSIAWVFLFANIGKKNVEPPVFGEIVGILCGISVGFICLYIYKKLIFSKDE